MSSQLAKPLSYQLHRVTRFETGMVVEFGSGVESVSCNHRHDVAVSHVRKNLAQLMNNRFVSVKTAVCTERRHFCSDSERE